MLDLEVMNAINLAAKSLSRIADALEDRNKLLTPSEAPQDESETEVPQIFRTLQTEQEGAGETFGADTPSTWSGRIERNIEAVKSRVRG
jgi:hypothetical protein